jgi:hypothetical protein
MQISLYNHRLSQLQKDNYKFAKVTCNALRCDQVEDDGTTPVLCINAYVSALKEISVPTNPKPKGSLAFASSASFQVNAAMPLKRDTIGKVIGKGGNVIKKISEVNNVKMTVGKWCEQDRENKSDLNVVFDGVLIKGQSNDVKNAIQSVTDILADYAKEEPLEKKKKF